MSIDTVENQSLPPGFESLEKYVSYWAAPTSQERWQRRSAASMEDIRKFYDDVLARSGEIIAYLDTQKLDDLPEDAARLSCLLFALANCSMAVELHGAPRAPHSPFPHGIRVLKGAWPLG